MNRIEELQFVQTVSFLRVMIGTQNFFCRWHVPEKTIKTAVVSEKLLEKLKEYLPIYIKSKNSSSVSPVWRIIDLNVPFAISL